MAAPTQAPATGGRQPFLKGSVIWQRKGPLPVWAWALLVLGLLLAWNVWRRNKAVGEAGEASGEFVDELPGDQSAPPVFIVPTSPPPPVTVNVPVTTVPGAPPGGGRPTPPVVPKPGAGSRRYMLRPDGSRVWIDPDVPGRYSGKTERIPWVKAETGPRRYRLLKGGGRTWLDLTDGGGRYNGKTQAVK